MNMKTKRQLPCRVSGFYKLADLPEAFRLFGTGDQKGKIIVTMA